jgi:hypothetical protein
MNMLSPKMPPINISSIPHEREQEWIHDDMKERASSGGNKALHYLNKGTGVFGIATKGREIIEWEYLKQARYNRRISGNFSKPIKHSLRTIRGIGRGTAIMNSFIMTGQFLTSDRSWGDYGKLGVGFISTGLTFTPEPITTGVGVGIGAMDMLGGFNSFYEWLDYMDRKYE